MYPLAASAALRRRVSALLAGLCVTLLALSGWSADRQVSVYIIGTPAQVAQLQGILTSQLPTARAIPAGAEEFPTASEEQDSSSGASPQPLTVRVNVTDPAATRLSFHRGSRTVAERELPRAGASDEVHFQELGLVIRSGVEALASSVPDAPTAGKGAADTSSGGAEAGGSGPVDAGAADASRPPARAGGTDSSGAEGLEQNSTGLRTPARLDFQVLYAATTYAKDPAILFGIGLGLEFVLQHAPLNPGFRLSTDNTTAFEFSDTRPRVAHLRGLASVGVERWLPARAGLGLSLERVVLDNGDERTTSGSLLATLLAELRLSLSDRVDGVLGSILDVQLGDSQVTSGSGPALQRHDLRLTTYLGLSITSVGER